MQDYQIWQDNPLLEVEDFHWLTAVLYLWVPVELPCWNSQTLSKVCALPDTLLIVVDAIKKTEKICRLDTVNSPCIWAVNTV